MDDFEAEGEWWLPDAPDHTVPGLLRLEGGRAEVEVSFGALSAQSGEVELTRWPVVMGQLTRSKWDKSQVTLFDVDEQRSGLSTKRLRASTATFGPVRSAQESFPEVRLQFDWLLGWLAPPRLVSGWDPLETRTLELETGEFEVCSARCENATVWFGGGTSYHTGPYRAEIDRYAFVRIVFDEPVHWRDIYERWVRPLQDLLVVVIGRPVQLTSVYLRPIESDQVHNESVAPWPQQDPISNASESRLVSWPSPVILFGHDFAPRCATLVPGWFEVETRFKQAVSRLTAPSYARFIYLDNECAFIAQAMESLHVQMFSAREHDPSTHAERVKAVAEALSRAEPALKAEDLAWATGVLQSRNDKSFAQRIGELLAATGSFGKLISESRPAVANELASLRHSVSHGARTKGDNETSDDTSRQAALRRNYFLKELAVWVLRVALLQHAGLPDAGERAIENGDLKQTLEVLAEEWPPSTSGGR